MNQLIKEAHKMADKMLLKSKVENAKKEVKEWLAQEVDGMTRAKIISIVAIPVFLIFLLS